MGAETVGAETDGAEKIVGRVWWKKGKKGKKVGGGKVKGKSKRAREGQGKGKD